MYVYIVGTYSYTEVTLYRINVLKSIFYKYLDATLSIVYNAYFRVLNRYALVQVLYTYYKRAEVGRVPEM